MIFSVLFVSLESAADVAMLGNLHDDDTTHLEEFGHQLDAHEDGTPDRELDGDHCDHCCHGHSPIIAKLSTPMTPLTAASESRVGRSVHIRNLAQAPPTPPPNA